jgi:hypothetical protein
MPAPETLSPALLYATKGNIKFPGTQTQATAAETAATARHADAHPTGVTIGLAGSIKPAT